MIVPDGSVLPPLPYLLGLIVAAVLVGAVLYRRDPPFSSRTVLALTPWMALGGTLHVVYVLELAPDVLRPLLGTPAVYVTTAIVAGLVWLVGLVRHMPDRLLGGVGSLGLIGAVVIVLAHGREADTLTVGRPAIGLVVASLLAASIWLAMTRATPEITAVMGWTGIALVFGHVLDGISTAVGVDLLGADERSPIPRAILEIAAQLPTAEAIGTGWLFVLVKIVVALAIVWIFVPFVEDTPRQGHVILALLTAVGIGPGTHNLLLFAVAG